MSPPAAIIPEPDDRLQSRRQGPLPARRPEAGITRKSHRNLGLCVWEPVEGVRPTPCMF